MIWKQYFYRHTHPCVSVGTREREQRFPYPSELPNKKEKTLAELHKLGTFKDIPDPVAWQREQR
jgi:hypothetical protein